MINENNVELKGIQPLDFTAENGHEPFHIFHKTSQKVFGLHEMNTTEGSFVKFQKKSEDPTMEDHQMWVRTPPQEEGDGAGRFMITNKKSELYLYADWHGYYTNGHIKIIHDGVEDCKLSYNY